MNDIRAKSAAAALGALVGKPSNALFDAVLVAALLVALTSLLGVHGGTGAAFYLLVALSAGYFMFHQGEFSGAIAARDARPLFIALSLPVLATLISKAVRLSPNLAELDSPSRFLLAVPVLLMLARARVGFIAICRFALPASLIVALIAALNNPLVDQRWEGRLATIYADPNTLGSYATVLTFLNLLLLKNTRGVQAAWALCGLAVGMTLSLFAASRGGWLAIVPMLIVCLGFRAAPEQRRALWLTGLVAAILLAGLVLLPKVGQRTTTVIGEAQSWLDGSKPETATGQRLTIWKLSLAMAAAHPMVGSGSDGIREQLASGNVPDVAPNALLLMRRGGPHNDLMGALLYSGLPGLLSVALLVFVPMAFFWRRRKSADGDARLACELGVCYTLGIFVCGLSNEMLSLKYLASYYGLMIAGLGAEVLARDAPAQVASPPGGRT